MLFAQLLDQGTDLQDLPGVKAHGRLVQNHDLGIAQNGLGDAHTLTVALGEVGDQPVGHGGDPGGLHGFFHGGGDLLTGNALETCHKGQILPGGHLGIDGGNLGKIPDFALDFFRFVKNVNTVQPYVASGGGQAAGDHIHGCGFSRAVGAEKTVDLSRFHGEGQMVNGGMIAVLLG